jgi:hypothetical protein
MTQQRLFTIAASCALLSLILFTEGCSRKAPQAGPAAPEVLVTTVTPKDVPRVLERVATLDGFVNANINAQVLGYIVSRVYQEGAASELVVQSGHNGCENREGEREVIRILRVELQRESAIAGR